MKARVKKIFENTESSPDLILVKNGVEPFIDKNFFYATNLKHGLFENTVAVLYPDGDIDLIVSQLEAEAAKKKGDLNLKLYQGEEEKQNFLKECLESGDTVGLNYMGVSHRDFHDLEEFVDKDFVDVYDGFKKSRMIKDTEEIEYIRRAAEIVDEVVGRIPGVVSDDMAEYELAAEINYLMQKNGADDVAFETISSFGGNTAIPHYTHGDRKLCGGDIILCDFGACFGKYNSDITRSFVFKKASDRQKEMYKCVLEAQRRGIDVIQPGVEAEEVHKVVKNFIDNNGFKGFFIHSTGHSLGLDVHDPGVGFKSDCDVELKENMVLTVEPGIYLPRYGGIRIEDDILVTKDGAELLTKSSKEFCEIS
ncbi:MAG: Xaa-Pro peptidase family protein [Candidatus Thermoplasmatota archaeon]